MKKNGNEKVPGVERAKFMLASITSWAIGEGVFYVTLKQKKDATVPEPTALETSEPYTLEHTLSKMVQMLMYVYDSSTL